MGTIHCFGVSTIESNSRGPVRFWNNRTLLMYGVAGANRPRLFTASTTLPIVNESGQDFLSPRRKMSTQNELMRSTLYFADMNEFTFVLISCKENDGQNKSIT